MIRMVQSSSAGHAKSYFSDALLKSDYYVNDQELQGHYRGKLAERMGIARPAAKGDFFALCENIHPITGEPLTARTREDRIIGYDVNFHCPKSLSVIHALSKDDHVLKAFQGSVNETMQDMEADSKTRVRKFGKQEDRETGEMIWAEFLHQTSRPVDGSVPDPHLHAHCFVFNATWDDIEKEYKAGKFRDIKRDMPYYQARFHKRLSDKLIDLGYQIKVTEKGFEIDGVPKNVVDLFSKRTDEIGRMAKEKGITDAKKLDQLGAKTRSKKQKGLSMDELKREWRQQIKTLDDEASKGSQEIRYSKAKLAQQNNTKECIDHAINHSFERASVIADRRLLATAYTHALGNRSVSLDDITGQYLSDTRLLHITEGSRKLSTTKAVLAEEMAMVTLARKGQGKLKPLYHTAPKLTLTGQQADAVSHILTTTDRVSIIRGAAGTGKTTLMQEAVSQIEKTGKKVRAFAPTALASHGVLKSEGFQNAETIARLLVDRKIQNDLRNQVIWLDEAGLVGTSDMLQVLKIADQQNARVILGGDTRQHASVVRGDALRILNTVGGIRTAEVSKIYRQKDPRYLDAVQDLSVGKVKVAFEKLNAIGSIKTIDPLKPNTDLVDDYMAALKNGKTALVISPTHRQGDEVTAHIRSKMKKAGMLGKKEVSVAKLSSLNLTQAQKADWRNYSIGQIIQFNQNHKRIKRGSTWSVQELRDRKVTLINANKKTIALPIEAAERYDVMLKSEIGLAKGDKVRITRNSFDSHDKRLNNGTMLEVAKVTKVGKITLRNTKSKTTYKLDAAFGHIDHAHCISSYGAQGSTVDEIFIHQPASTFPATDAKQFYVSVSRGREKVSIYTDDKESLLDYASELGDRQSALELVSGKTNHQAYVEQLQRKEVEPMKKLQTELTKFFDQQQNKDRNYEPEL